MATCGWPVKSGVEATNATTLTIRLTFARSPISALTAAIAFSAHCWAHSTASSWRDLAADLAGGISSPDAHRQLAGGEDVVAAAHGRDVDRDRLGHLGHRQAELGEPLLGALAQPRAAA